MKLGFVRRGLSWHAKKGFVLLWKVECVTRLAFIGWAGDAGSPAYDILHIHGLSKTLL